MKSTFFLVMFTSLFLSTTLSAQTVKPKASTSNSRLASQYQVLLWTKDANIKIKGKSIKKDAVFSYSSDIEFSAANQWINTIKVGSNNQGYIFTYDCSSGTCKILKTQVTAHKYRLETKDPRELLKRDAVSSQVVKTN